MKIIVTGGAGFIGSEVIRQYIRETEHTVINIDNLTYAGNLDSLKEVLGSPRYIFEKVDICDAKEVSRVLHSYKPNAIMHLAAESHVDRSIDGPSLFVKTNIEGTGILLETAREYRDTLDTKKKEAFRFHHVSTDEVYGSLGETGYFTETTAYNPSSPYAASKAASDHLVNAWYRTYGLPVVMSNCSNNYGPYQFPEKLIPLIILNALEGKSLPIYGEGNNVRDWLYVADHVKALRLILEKGTVGETYNIGGHSERTNRQVVEAICSVLNELVPAPTGKSYASSIEYVADRLGHDKRYAIDASKIEADLGWVPNESFETGLRKTIQWYIENKEWCQHIQDRYPRRQRIGLTGVIE